MEKIETGFQCPMCKHEMADMAQVNLNLLRMLMISQIVPALVHDAGHSLEMVHFHRRQIERELGSKASEPLKDLLRRDDEACRKMHDFMHTLRDLYRNDERDAEMPLALLPDRLGWFCSLCEFPALVDFGPLKRSQSHVSFGVYWDAFRFAVQGALLAIRRDRNPGTSLEFNVLENELTTTLAITRTSQPEHRPVEWAALEWLIRSAGGTVHISTDGDKRILRWSVHLK